MNKEFEIAVEKLVGGYFKLSGSSRITLSDEQHSLKIEPLEDGAFTLYYKGEKLLKDIAGTVTPEKEADAPFLYMNAAKVLEDKFGCVIADYVFIDRIGNLSYYGKNPPIFFKNRDDAMKQIRKEAKKTFDELGCEPGEMDIDEETGEGSFTSHNGDDYCSWVILPAKKPPLKEEIIQCLRRARRGLTLYSYDLQDTGDCYTHIYDAIDLLDTIGDSDHIEKVKDKLREKGFGKDADSILQIVLKELLDMDINKK